MDFSRYSLVEIKDTKNPLFLDWLDIYETSFPFHERKLLSMILKQVDKINNGEDTLLHFMALIDDRKECQGIILYQLMPVQQAVCLWYLAVKADLRSKGLGGYFYDQAVRLFDPSCYKIMILEVEIPGEENRIDAERRIQFYERHGARLLEGIDYIQDIGWHAPPTPMHLMIHSLQSLDAESAFTLAKGIFGDLLQQAGKICYR